MSANLRFDVQTVSKVKPAHFASTDPLRRFGNAQNTHTGRLRDGETQYPITTVANSPVYSPNRSRDLPA
jgi:hypothetical protein